MRFIVTISGGSGPDRWEGEDTIKASEFLEAAHKAQDWAEEQGGAVVAVELAIE